MPPSAARAGHAPAEAADLELELGVFSYMVSHDLAASFRHVSEFSRLLLADLGDGLNERQQQYADYIRTASSRCQSMLEQVLVFSRVQQALLQPVCQDATQSVEIALRQLAMPQTALANVTTEPLGEIRADPKLLVMALEQLLDNALKFHRSGVRSRVAVRPAHDADAWRVRISDNGIGVDARYREQAFEMFRRLNAEDAFPGVGAGLAICRRIARRHGGDVHFIDCDEGACVELVLPRTSPSDQPS